MIETGWVKNPNAPTPDGKELIFGTPSGRMDSQRENIANEPKSVCGEDLTPGWLEKQFNKVEKEVESWPADMKKAAGFEKPLLSILIPTVISRHKKCNELLTQLYAQRDALPMPDRVEILTLSDNGEMMVGEKRNKLLEMATGEYLCFFDDDDTPFGNYLVKIIEALETRPDVVGITIFWTDDVFKSVRLLVRSLDYQQYHWLVTNESATVTCGRPAHLNPTRSSIAKSVKFPENMTAGEDAAWSAIVAGKLKTCVNIDVPIYYYNFQTEGTITQRPGAREAMRAPLPDGYQYAFRDGKIVTLDKRGILVQK